MNTLQLSKPYIPNNNRVNQRHSGSGAFIPIGTYLHSLSLPLRLAPPNVNTYLFVSSRSVTFDGYQPIAGLHARILYRHASLS